MRFLVAALAILLIGFVGLGTATAQEETTGEGDVLTRYDDDLTQQLAADYEAAKQEQEAYLEENPTASYPIKDEASALSNARMRAIENSSAPEDKEARAAELRRQAASLRALQSWADGENVNVQSDAYLGGAERVAEEYEEEVEDLEEEVAEEAAQQEAAQEETAKASEETTGTAAGGAGGETPEESASSPSQKLDGSGGSPEQAGNTVSGGGVNLLPVALLVAAALAGVYLFARSRGGIGNLTESFSGLPKAPKPKASTKPATEPTAASRATTQTREAPPGSPGREESQGPPQPRVTPEGKSSTDTLDDESLAAWFSREMDGEEKKEPRRSEREERRREGPTEEIPEAPQKNVNQMVAEEVTRMREAGELSEGDEVEVRVESGRIVVRKKE